MLSQVQYDESLMVELELSHDADAGLEIEQQLAYASNPDLEVELEVVTEPVRLLVDDDGSLDDEWFGEYDETQPIECDWDDQPTKVWSRLSTWVRSGFKRAA